MASTATARNAKIDATLKAAADAGDVPGVVAMATDRTSTIYEGAFGKRVLGEPAAMTLDTVGWIASMTKALTGAAAMQLVEQGKLDLDAPAAKVVPDLGKAQVLEGFDAGGQPRTRRAQARRSRSGTCSPTRRASATRSGARISPSTRRPRTSPASSPARRPR